MESINFVLDIIVTHLESPEIQDFSAVQVSAVFGNVKVNLSASSINVTEFKAGAGVNLKASPKKFRKSLEDCGLALTVSYKTKAIGVGQILLPQNTIDMIEAGMSDLMYTGSCSFEREGEYVGKLEVLCRLIIKCDELPNQVEPACVSNVDKAINRQDIMFVLSESQRCPNFCDPCQEALEADEGNEMLKLDLGRYHSPAGKGQRLSEIFKHNPTANNACCQLKEMADECEQIVDSITNRIGQPKDIKSPCRVPEGPELDGICNIPNQYFQDSIGLTSLGPCFSYIPAREGEGPDFCDPALIPAPISDLNKPFVKPPRFCPICLTNMSWLPKLASCPKCGAKAMPVIEERHKEKKLTPDQIIQEFLGKTTNPERCEDPCEKAERERNDEGECANRCACECGKFCAHCRIRQLCADIFKASKNEMECPKVMPKSSEDFCVKDENSQDCKPYLARVFSELRDLYEIKDTLRINNCGQKSDPKEIYPPEKSSKLVKSSKCNKPIKRNPPISSGLHKNCVKSEGAVARNRGWAWDLREEAWKYGWRPGFVKKSVKRVMKFFLRYSPDDTAFNTCDTVEETAMKEQQDQPTLNVCKKNGEIIVTLQPINNGAAQMEPIVFRVVKSDLAVALSAIKRKLKAKGFPKCTCHNTVMMCVCRDIIEKKHLEMAIEKESKRWGMESCVNDLVLTDTSDSEVEYDFNVSPPAASASPRVKRTTLNNGTQTVKKDLVVPSKYPMKLGSYWRAYDCAAGDRYTGTAFGNPGEAVFEDGLFGHGGGGPHGASAAPGGRPKIPGIWGSGQGGPMRGGGRSGGPGGMGGAGGAGGGGPGGLSALFKDKSFPGNKNQQGKGKSAPIPVRMPKRHYEKLKNAAKAEKEAKLREIANKKKGVNLMNYLMKDGAIPTPWDPSNPKPAKTAKQMLKEEEEKKERLQAGERKRRELLGMAIPPLESMPRLGRGYDPCQCCYNPCAAQCCYPCWYN